MIVIAMSSPIFWTGVVGGLLVAVLIGAIVWASRRNSPLNQQERLLNESTDEHMTAMRRQKPPAVGCPPKS